MPTTLDFHIHLQQKSGYRLEVFERGNSQPLAHGTFDFDLSYMTAFEINRLDVDDKDPQGRLERLREFGAKLHAKLFNAEIQKLWQTYKDKNDFLELCLRIAPEAKGLEALPWETLFDGEEFIAAGARTGLSRLPLDVAIQNNLPALPPPLKMLAFISSPLDLQENERLQIEREQEILLQAVNAPSGQGMLQLTFEDEAKLPILEDSLAAGFHILHYSGHGLPPENGGGLLLEDAEGKKRSAAIGDLLQSLQKGEKDLRLVVLSGCQTARTVHVAGFRDLARGLALRKIPAVIAMQFSITDAAGLLFAENLYHRLLEGKMLVAVLSECRRSLLHSDNPLIKADAFAPVLIAANNYCLQTDQTVRTLGASGQSMPKIDFNFHLPLPQLSFGFYGRRREYRALRDGLIHKNLRAMIVHGIGGVGKTALISHTAERLYRNKNFKGVYAFDCTSAAIAPETIVLDLHRYFERQGITTLAQLLHQSFPPEQLATYLGQVLSQVPLLLIFDNFETQLTSGQSAVNSNQYSVATHVIADDNLRAFLMTLVKTTAPRAAATATATQFLFTSRYLFDLDAKRVGAIQAVPLHDLSRPEALGLMQKLPYLSAAGYGEKLRAFETFGGHPYALVTLDRHCGHKPLAEVLKDAAEVHSELREFIAIELSYAKLSERSRELLNHMAAFRKSVPYAAAEWVIGIEEKIELSKDFLENLDRNKMPKELQAMSEEELLHFFERFIPKHRTANNIDQPIAELIGWGLLTPIEENSQLEAFAVHTLVRDFCRGKLPDVTWVTYLVDGAAYYTNQTKLLKRDDKTIASVWLEMEAFELLMEAKTYEQAVDVLLEIQELLFRWGLDRFLEAQYRQVVSLVKEKTQAIILGNIALMLQERGEYETAINEYGKLQEIFKKLGDWKNMAVSMHLMGIAHQNQGNYDAAIDEYKKSLKIREEIGDRSGIAKSLGQIGSIYVKTGKFDLALDVYASAMLISEELEDASTVAALQHQIGIIHHQRGDHDAALTQYKKSLNTRERLNDRKGVAVSLHQLGRIYEDRREYSVALDLYNKSLKIVEELGDRAGVADVLHQIGMIHHKRGDYDAAIVLYEKSLNIRKELGDREGVALSLHQIGIIHQEHGDSDKALAYHSESLQIKEELGSQFGIASSIHQIAQILMLTNKFPEAFENFLIAISIFSKLQSPDSKIAANSLKSLRKKWGAENFDAAWREKTGEEVPEFLKTE